MRIQKMNSLRTVLLCMRAGARQKYPKTGKKRCMRVDVLIGTATAPRSQGDLERTHFIPSTQLLKMTTASLLERTG